VAIVANRCGPGLERRGLIREYRPMRWLWLVIGFLLVLTGVVWTLQGLDLLGGSAMSGNRMWAVIGPVVAIAGLAVAGAGLRRRAGGPPR
jgi:hypothetical protein